MGTVGMPNPGISTEWASITLICVMLDERARLVVENAKATQEPAGFILVINRREYGKRAEYKMPGGRNLSADHTPLNTAIREVHEETGIIVPPERMTYVDGLFVGGKSPSHWKYFFRADIFEHEANQRHSRHSGNEGEEPWFFTKSLLSEMARTNQLLKSHRYWLELHGFLPKPAIAA